MKTNGQQHSTIKPRLCANQSNGQNLTLPLNRESSSGFPTSGAKRTAPENNKTLAPFAKARGYALKQAQHAEQTKIKPENTLSLRLPSSPTRHNGVQKVSKLAAIKEAVSFAYGIHKRPIRSMLPQAFFLTNKRACAQGQIEGPQLALQKRLNILASQIKNFTIAVEKMPQGTQRQALLTKIHVLEAAYQHFPKNTDELAKMRLWLNQQNTKVKDALLIFLHSSHTNGANKVGIDIATSAQEYAHPVVIMPEAGGDIPKSLHQKGIATAVINPKANGGNTQAYLNAVSEHSNGAKYAVLNTLMNFQLTESVKKQNTKVMGVVHEGLPVRETPAETRAALQAFIKNTFKRDDFSVDRLLEVFGLMDAVIVPCNAELENYTQLAPTDTRDKFKAILNGVCLKLADQTIEAYTPESARSAIGIKKNAFVIFQLATFYERKSNRATIAAASKLHKDWENSGKKGTEPILLLIGARISKLSEARYIANMVADIRAAGLKANFGPDKIHTFTENGTTHHIAIPEFIKPDDERFKSGEYEAVLLPVMDQTFCLKAHRAASVSVCPSISELLPLSILESMAMQVPQVASNIAGIPEVVKSGENGVLIDAGDVKQLTQALAHLRLNPEKAQQFGLHGRRLVEEEHTMDAMLEAYKDTLASLEESREPKAE